MNRLLLVNALVLETKPSDRGRERRREREDIQTSGPRPAANQRNRCQSDVYAGRAPASPRSAARSSFLTRLTNTGSCTAPLRQSSNASAWSTRSRGCLTILASSRADAPNVVRFKAACFNRFVSGHLLSALNA